MGAERIQIPPHCWMRYRKSGVYKYALNKRPIVWTVKQPPKGAKVYTVAWFSGQGPIVASGTFIQT